MRNLIQKHKYTIDQIHLQTIGLATMKDRLYLIISIKEQNETPNKVITIYKVITFTTFGTAQYSSIPEKLFNKVILFNQNRVLSQVLTNAFESRLYFKKLGYESTN